MPYYYFSEVWTPLSKIGIKFFRDDEGKLWYKLGKHTRRRLGFKTKVTKKTKGKK
ncbi:hypothetical protein [Paenibacillus eucommiae]|uniref:Uncharacterized protein n=1 Tax=Paenibacillus eucommiae TaxID=1355755 RepID=A0ABS4J6R2_9BACL|nr:hypothetical protein [Paenibacillus eucommiae]MBP1995542.1 hypothetical protein [Paenibacillus eucommiae]